MSASPTQVRSAKAAGLQVPIARLPERPAPALPVDVPGPPPEWDWRDAEILKSWAGSVTMHAILLVILAFWYFAPRLNEPVKFDSRLAGSPNGVIEGETLTGGLNTPLPMPAPPLVDTELAADSLSLAQLELKTIEPEIRFRTAKKPTGGGGAPNNNPGAGDGDGFGLARFGEGGELIHGVTVKVGDPQFTLIWNTDNVDLDLHVLEPGGKEIYWEDPKGRQGGELDVDNTKGFGPENIYWLVESEGPGSKKIKGPGPSGTYKWYVVYWGGFGGIARPTHWQVRVKHDGKVTVHHGKFSALNERSKIYTLKVDPVPGKSSVPAPDSDLSP
ncbi:MAG: YfaP family protein [Isosphaerales bacterium]